MNMIYVGLETLKSLYSRGYITAEALTVLAPILGVRAIQR